MRKKENRKVSAHTLPIITCECGEKILVIPDLHQMERCIEAHASQHEKSETDSKKAGEEHCRIEEQLTQKVLNLVAQGRLLKGKI